MTHEVDVLRAKIGLFIQALRDDPNASTLRGMFLEPLDAMVRARRISTARLRAIHRGLDRFLGLLSEEQRSSIHKELLTRFGSIPVDASMVIAGIIRRGYIANDTEAEVARDFVSQSSNELVLGAQEFARLADLLDKAQY